jgi:hypothetical protein
METSRHESVFEGPQKLSEKGYEQRSEREFGRYTEEKMGPWVVCRATLQALSTLFGQFLRL